jgi:hypothetical protein
MRVVWRAAVNRFVDIESGRFVAASKAIPHLKVSGGAIRDTLGRFTPYKAHGGDIVSEWPTGKANYVAVTRRVKGDVDVARVREQDMLSGTVDYSYQGGEKKTIEFNMPKGREHNPEIFTERIANRISGHETGYSKDFDFESDVAIIDDDWHITTWYEEGTPLGSDFAWFEA